MASLLLLVLLFALASSTSAAKSLGGLFQSFCYLQTDGQVYCFGNNERGGLGTGTLRTSPFPALMKGVRHASDVSVGQLHTCIVDDRDDARCVGDNGALTLGDGSDRAFSTALVDVATAAVDQVFAGYQQSCALSKTGGVKCWGINTYGEAGDGTRLPRSSPVAVKGFESSGARDVGLGSFHACILTSYGQVACAGLNSNGQLGDGTMEDRSEMTVVRFQNNEDVELVSVSGGAAHTCAASSAGDVYCWGNDEYGQLGQGQRTAGSLVPVKVELATGDQVSAVWAGYATTIVLQRSGSAMGFGENGFGQLATGDTSRRYSATAIAANRTDIAEVRGGTFTTCVLLRSGSSAASVECAGDNSYGQLGNNRLGEDSLVLSPVVVGGPQQDVTFAPAEASNTPHHNDNAEESEEEKDVVLDPLVPRNVLRTEKSGAGGRPTSAAACLVLMMMMTMVVM